MSSSCSKALLVFVALCSTGAYIEIQDEGTSLYRHPIVNFTGDIECGGDAAAGKTTCNVTAGDFGALSATLPITQSGGTISTSMATSRLIGRTTASAGVMEEITVASPLSLSALTLDITAIADTDLANNYSGVGSCGAGSGVTATVDNATPTCDANVAFDDDANTFTADQNIAAQGDFCLQDSAGGDKYCFQSEATAPAGTTTLTLNIDTASCTSNGGALTVSAGEIICSADDGGSGSPGGQTTEVQFNNASAFDGADRLTFASSTAGAAFGAGTTTAGTWPTLGSGSVLTTAEDNAIENDGNAFYGTTDAGNRGYIPFRNCIRADATRNLTSTGSTSAVSIGQWD